MIGSTFTPALLLTSEDRFISCVHPAFPVVNRSSFSSPFRSSSFSPTPHGIGFLFFFPFFPFFFISFFLFCFLFHFFPFFLFPFFPFSIFLFSCFPFFELFVLFPCSFFFYLPSRRKSVTSTNEKTDQYAFLYIQQGSSYSGIKRPSKTTTFEFWILSGFCASPFGRTYPLNYSPC